MSFWNVFLYIISIIATAAISIFVSWYFRDRKQLEVIISENNIIKRNDDFKKMKIYYDNLQIDELYYHKVDVKNTGNRNIEKEDFLGKGISIDFDEKAEIFEYYYEFSEDLEEEYWNPKLIRSHNSIMFELDNLEKGERFSIIILDNSDPEPDVNIRIKGGKVNYYYEATDKQMSTNEDDYYKLGIPLLCLVVIIALLVMIYVDVWDIYNPTIIITILYVLLGATSGPIIAHMIKKAFRKIKRLFKSLLK